MCVKCGAGNLPAGVVCSNWQDGAFLAKYHICKCDDGKALAKANELQVGDRITLTNHQPGDKP